VAVTVGLVVSRISVAAVLKPKLLASLNEPESQEEHHHHDKEPGGCCSCETHQALPQDEPSDRLVAAFRSAMKDFIDVGVYFTIGVAITALFNTGIAPGAAWLDSLAGNVFGAPAALMALAFILSLCSTSDAFIAATLDKFAMGAKLAFLTFGPMMDVKLMFLYQTVMRKNFIIALAVALFVLIGGISILLQHLMIQTP
jgi:uncharacterized membrane protein YraQ (UPF0718 family)